MCMVCEWVNKRPNYKAFGLKHVNAAINLHQLGKIVPSCAKLLQPLYTVSIVLMPVTTDVLFAVSLPLYSEIQTCKPLASLKDC